MKKITILTITFLISLSAFAKSKKDKASLLQMQEDTQRFYSRFTERIVDAYSVEHAADSKERFRALRQYMLYDSESLKIATGPFPVVNLLDMMVFIKLNRFVVREYWIPKVFGKSASGVLKAFRDSEKDIDDVALRYMKTENILQVNQVVKRWRRENPNNIRVEKIRLADFSKYASAKGDKKKSFQLINLVVNTEEALEAVDDVVLLSNRAIFLAQNLPLIMRLEARVGVQEILGDSIKLIQSAPKLINEAGPLVSDLAQLARESNALLTSWSNYKKGRKKVDVHHALDQVDGVLKKTMAILTSMNEHGPGAKNTFQKMSAEVYKMIWFIAFIIIFVAVAVSAIWWTGYYISKKKLIKVS